MLAGNVLITGGAGFLARGIVRRAKREDWPCQFTIYSRDEQKQDKMRQRWPDLNYVLGDILDLERLALVATSHDTLIHAAAIKYIPEGEFNVSECVRVNIDGSRNVVTAMRLANIKIGVFISTDKAVLPINAYGMTKAVMERLVGEAAQMDPSRTYVACRYGNVIGSTGSVIPVFQRQLKVEGVMSITDPDMTRFWISVDDAVDLILAAADLATSGSIVIPQPRSMKLIDLADAILGHREASASERAKHIRIDGKRPGEKMHEDLLSDSERQRTRALRAGETDDYYELLPPGNGNYGDVPKLTSAEPKSWITGEEMTALIRDAATV